MKLFTTKGNKLTSISAQPFKLEKEIQTLVEGNLSELFGIEFVKSELKVKEFRIDTLAYDRESKAFVIIEYKKDRNFSIIDQGYTYLSLMLNNKSDFVLEYNENQKDNLKRDDVDWSQSRVIFISPNFTEYQKNSVNFKDVPFELWEIKRYENGLIGFIEHRTSSNVSISTVKTAGPDNVVGSVSKEITVYNEEYHYRKNSRRDPRVIDLYEALKERILGLGNDIEVIPRKEYIGFRRGRPFSDIVFYTDHLRVILNVKKGMLDDAKEFCKDLSSQGHWGNGDYEFRLYPDSELEYPMFLINQSYKRQEP
jgi:predicted transport protein